MFDYIFTEVREHFGRDGDVFQMPAPEWKMKATGLLASLFMEMEYLFSTAKAIFSDEVFKHSQTECLYPTRPVPAICSVRLAPHEDVWNPLGMRFEGTLHTGYTGAAFAQPDIFFELSFWGDTEIEALRCLSRNHKRVVELLLDSVNVQLETNCPVRRLEKYRGRDVGKKLELYFEGPDEDNVILTLTSEFRADAKAEAIIRTFWYS